MKGTQGQSSDTGEHPTNLRPIFASREHMEPSRCTVQYEEFVTPARDI